MALKYVGEKQFTEQCEPIPAKNEFGIDTLQRKMRGATDNLEAYLAGLAQGNKAPSPWGALYLQTWETDGNPKGYTEVTLHYKGLLSGKIPDPKISFSNATKSTTITAKNSNDDDVTYDILYISPQVIYKSVLNTKKGGAPSYDFAGDVTIRSSIYTDPDTGQRRGGFPPNLKFRQSVENDVFDPVYGSPYFERETTVSGVIEQA